MSKIILPAIGTAMPKLGGTFWAIQRALPGSGQAAIAQEQPVRRCKTCKSFTLSNSAVCRSCNEDYCNWEPKP